jgi:hypothetical protein
LTQEATLRTRRRATTLVPPPSPTVPDIEAAPELAAIILLEHALDVVGNALLAEHPTLIDDFHRPSEEGPVLCLANIICRRASTLLDLLRRYRQAVRLAASSTPTDDPGDDVPF